MDLQTAFQTLGELVDRYGSDGRSVERVETTTVEPRDGTLRAAVDLRIPFDALLVREPRRTGEPHEVTLSDDGSVEFFVSVPPLRALPSVETDGVSVTEEAVQLGDDHLRLTLEVAVETTDGQDRRTGSVEATAVPDETPAADGGIENALAAERDESVPPYEDTEYLRSLYEVSDNFAEMSQRIVMDVSSETVRRYMIEAGIHEPKTYDTVEGDGGEDTVEGNDDGDDTTTGREESSTDDGNDEETQSTETGSAAGDENDGGETDDRASQTDDRSDATPCDGAASPRPSVVSEKSCKRVVNGQVAGERAGLPEGIRVEDVADAVVDSVTVYEVQQHLSLDRDQTRSLLADLDLLDLVSRQISALDRTVSYGQVAERLRHGTQSSA